MTQTGWRVVRHETDVYPTGARAQRSYTLASVATLPQAFGIADTQHKAERDRALAVDGWSEDNDRRTSYPLDYSQSPTAPAPRLYRMVTFTVTDGGE